MTHEPRSLSLAEATEHLPGKIALVELDGKILGRAHFSERVGVLHVDITCQCGTCGKFFYRDEPIETWPHVLEETCDRCDFVTVCALDVMLRIG